MNDSPSQVEEDSPLEENLSEQAKIDLKQLQAQEQRSTPLLAKEEPTKPLADEVLLEKKIANKARQQYIDLQKLWSWAAFGLLCIMVLAQISIIFLIGFGLVKYIGYIPTLNMFFGQTFLQIIGLAYVVVKFLFPPGSGTGLQSSISDVPKPKKTKN